MIFNGVLSFVNTTVGDLSVFTPIDEFINFSSNLILLLGSSAMKYNVVGNEKTSDSVTVISFLNKTDMNGTSELFKLIVFPSSASMIPFELILIDSKLKLKSGFESSISG